MKILLPGIAILLSVPFRLCAQTNTGDTYDFDEILVTAFSELIMEKEDETVTGSPYLFKEWAKASMEVKLGNHSQEIAFDWVRYNIERDLVEVIHNEQPLVTEGDLIIEMNLADPRTGKNRRLVPIEGMAKYAAEDYSGLCELLADGPVKLIRHFRKELLAANYDPALDVGEKKDQLIHLENIFLVKGGLYLKANGKKDFVDTLHDVEIKSFIKEEKLNLRNEEDMIKAVNYYNETINSGSG